MLVRPEFGSVDRRSRQLNKASGLRHDRTHRRRDVLANARRHGGFFRVDPEAAQPRDAFAGQFGVIYRDGIAFGDLDVRLGARSQGGPFHDLRETFEHAVANRHVVRAHRP